MKYKRALKKKEKREKRKILLQFKVKISPLKILYKKTVHLPKL